jgi:hypothetical protein
MTALSKATLCISTGAAMLLATAAPVAAATLHTEGPPPMDPMAMWVNEMMPRDDFLLYSNRETELVRYKTPRDTEVCVARVKPNGLEDPRKATPVRVTWDNDVSTVYPGNCMSFDAKSVKIRPASPLNQDEVISGTFRVTHH